MVTGEMSKPVGSEGESVKGCPRQGGRQTRGIQGFAPVAAGGRRGGGSVPNIAYANNAAKRRKTPEFCGRDAVVASYLEFLQAATLDHFEVLDLDVFPFTSTAGGNTCMAHLTFAVTYTLDGETYVEKGLEAYTRIKIINAAA